MFRYVEEKREVNPNGHVVDTRQLLFGKFIYAINQEIRLAP